MNKINKLKYCANELPNNDHSICCGVFNKYVEIPTTEIIILKSSKKD